MSNYYAANNGSAGNSGTFASPWDLQTAFWNGSQTAGDTLWLRGGTYTGKFTSTLNGGTVRSYCYALPGGYIANPSEWAKIDGYLTTTLSADINSSVQTFDIASTAGVSSGDVIVIDTEEMQIDTVVDGNTVFVNRGGGGFTGAASHSGGATVRFIGVFMQLKITGSNTTYRDFEVMTSYPQRDFEPGGLDGTLGCCGHYYKIRGAGVGVFGYDNKVVNLYVHDNADGLGSSGSLSSNTEFYGNLVINNGGYHYDSGEARENGSGMGFYLANDVGYSKVYANISINNFAYNGQFSSSTGEYAGGDHQDNIFANAGSPLGGVIFSSFRNPNYLYGPDQQQSPTANIVNNHFWSIATASGGPATLGYGAGIDVATVTGNYFIGGPKSVIIQGVNTMTFTGNKVYNASGNYIFDEGPVTSSNWNNNTYYDSGGRSVFYFNDNSYDFAGFKTATGFDASSTETSVAMPDTVVVIPNTYETGRANVVIYAYSGATSINVNLSTTGLVHGQSYVIKNAFNYFGTDVFTGTYNSASPTISLPLDSAAATAVAEPIGLGFTPATTLPDFGVFIVMPGATAQAVKASFSGGVKMSNVKVG